MFIHTPGSYAKVNIHAAKKLVVTSTLQYSVSQWEVMNQSGHTYLGLTNSIQIQFAKLINPKPKKEKMLCIIHLRVMLEYVNHLAGIISTRCGILF